MAGTLIIAGGNLEASEQQIHKTFIEKAGGAKAKFCIVPTASGKDPQSTINHVSELWRQLGIGEEQIVLLPVYGEEGDGWEIPSQGDKMEILEMLEDITGLWFTGGDQYYTHKAFVRKDGSDSYCLAKMREIYQRGGVIGGTSAGAAIMSKVMIGAGTNKGAFCLDGFYDYENYDDEGDKENLFLVKGLGFFEDGIIDQHFDRRSRMFRLIRAIQESPQENPIGFGVSEDTAILYDKESKTFEVIGTGAVYIVDCKKMQIRKKEKQISFSCKDVRLHILGEGDSYIIPKEEIVFS